MLSQLHIDCLGNLGLRRELRYRGKDELKPLTRRERKSSSTYGRPSMRHEQVISQLVNFHGPEPVSQIGESS